MKMIVRIALSAQLLASIAAATQPSAPAPVSAPMRDLVWGKLNVLHTSDTHGWLAGHLQEAQYSADWGDYISFASRMHEKADEQGVDLLLVDTGDRVDGNGLYDASSPKGQFTFDVLKQQDIDIICSGNHELYKAADAERELTSTVPSFQGKYLASNIDIIDPETGEPTALAQRYTKFTTKNQGIKVVAFGFLFDFTVGANNTIIQPVKKTIKEDWFQEAIREDADIFIVIGHVGLDFPEFNAIYSALRSQNWDTPIQFFGGHTHIRDFKKFDSSSYAMESGRYMETVGWLSIDGLKGTGKTDSQPDDVETSASLKFRRRYIDNNLYSYYHHTGLDESTFPTELGQNVSTYMQEARNSLKLDEKYGCAPQDYWTNRAPYPSADSLLSWIETEVLPDIINVKNETNKPSLGLINSGALRFDVFKGPFTRDTTYIMSPFTSGFLKIRNVPYATAKKLLLFLNNGGRIFETEGLPTTRLTVPEQMAIHHDIVPSTERLNFKGGSGSQKPLGLHVTDESKLVPGYTTNDDAGDDGDDTIHSPLTFYRVPNCVQAEVSYPEEGEPESVDVIFLEFIKPWVLLALKLGGESYDESDISVYRDGKSFTDFISDWVSDNWDNNC